MDRHSIDQPSFFPVRIAPDSPLRAPAPRLGVSLRTACRSLTGMLKEAIVTTSATASGWRLLSDEGPYLEGGDTAPCPLAFMLAGMAGGYLNSVRALARAQDIAPDGLTLVEDHRYAMQGSALRGTMTGSAEPIRLDLAAGAGSQHTDLMGLLREAVDSTPATALVRKALPSEFSLTLNGERVATARVAATRTPVPAVDPGDFGRIGSLATGRHADLVRRLEAVSLQSAAPGASFAPEQDRRLRLRGDCSVFDDSRLQVVQRMFNPAGSTFRLLLAARETGRVDLAPDDQALLAAGIAFCFMTQLGRYARIMRRRLDNYWIVQDLHLAAIPRAGEPPSPAGALPVETHLFVESPEDAAFARQLLDMGEQTCFLHALCRTPLEVRFGSVPADPG